MKVLVATGQKQGARDGDFSFTIEGELIALPVECDADEDIDGDCGCRRSLAGLSSAKGTTTVRVAEVDTTLDEYAEAIRDAFERGGWGDNLEAADNQAYLLAGIADQHELGAVLERRGGTDFQVR